MAWIWEGFYIVAVGAVLWLLHTSIGKYAPPLPRSGYPRWELFETLLLWGAAFIFSILMVLVISPWINHAISDRTFGELVQVPLISVVCIGLPFLVVVKRCGWTAEDLGLTWKIRSWPATIFALLFGILSGGIAYASGQAVVGMPLPDQLAALDPGGCLWIVERGTGRDPGELCPRTHAWL